MKRSSVKSSPSLAPINMADKNIQYFESADVNGEASQIETKNDKYMASNKCSQRDYASTQAGNLRTHMKTHTGEKSKRCNQCFYASSRAGNLKAHMKTHTGEKSNKCILCDYASSQAGSLKRHMKKHTGEKSTGRQGI